MTRRPLGEVGQALEQHRGRDLRGDVAEGLHDRIRLLGPAQQVVEPAGQLVRSPAQQSQRLVEPAGADCPLHFRAEGREGPVVTDDVEGSRTAWEARCVLAGMQPLTKPLLGFGVAQHVLGDAPALLQQLQQQPALGAAEAAELRRGR